MATAGTMDTATIDFENDYPRISSFVTTCESKNIMTVWPSLLRPRLRILSSPEISTSQMLLLPHGPLVPPFHRCKSPRRGGRSIRRTARARAPERGHVGATARRQESVPARASGRPRTVAPPHTRNCADPACIHSP